MERPAVNATAERRADNHGHRGSPSIMVLGRHLGDLVEGAGNKVRELHLHDRAQAHHGCADRRADNSRFCKRRIKHPPLTVFLEKAFGDLEGPSVHTDIFTHQEHPFITGHLLVKACEMASIYENSCCFCVVSVAMEALLPKMLYVVD